MYANIFIKKEFEYTMKYDIQKLSAKGIEFFTILNFESKIKLKKKKGPLLSFYRHI
jgi:hypothetical protein